MPVTSGLPVTRYVSVQVSLTTPAITAEAPNTLLLLGTTPGVINATERMRSYANLAGVAADFATTTEEYLAATLWFGQSPSPTSLFIGRWVKTASAGRLIGASLTPTQQSIASWNAITTGAFGIAVDGGATTQITALNFSTAINLNGVASIIQTALAVAHTGMTCVWNLNYDRFEIASGTTGSTSSVAFLTSPTSGTDISGAGTGTPPVGLMMTAASSGAYTVAGALPETAVTAVALLDAMFSSQWYALVIPAAVDTDHQAVAAYVEAASPPHYYGVSTNEGGALVAGNTTDIGYILMGFGYNKTAVQFSNSNPTNAICSYLARILTTQWTGVNTTITLMYKQEPGVVPENLTTTQANSLQSKNYNVLVTVANGAVLIEYGTSCSGQFTDTIIGADALALDVQNSLFNVLYTSPTKVPQTDAGMQLLLNAASASCGRYSGNGLLGSGIWNAQGFGTLDTGDLLTLGYYVWAPSILTQSQGDRAARRAPLIQIAAKLAGAVHTASVIIFVNS